MKPFLSIRELKQLIDKKEVTSDEVLEYYRQRITRFNPQLNAVIETFAFSGAKQNKNSYGTGPLAGVPGLIKDNISQRGHATSCGSNVLRTYTSPYDATAIDNLKQQGALMLGRTNMDEFAMGASGEFSAYGPARNPWDLKRSPGGSSSGSAAAVSAGLVPWALGSETGGSVRQPASFTGLVGMYPTYGRVSRYGLVAFASSTDQIGPLTKTVYDNALVLSAIASHDAKDSLSIPEPHHDFTKKLDGRLPEGIRIGVIKDSLESAGVHDQIRTSFSQAIERLERMGAQIKYISMPHLRYGISVYFILSRAEAASNLSRYDGSLFGHRSSHAANLEQMYLNTRGEGFGDEVKRRILMGNFVLSAGHHDKYYGTANRMRSMIRADFDEAYQEVDLLTSPTTTLFPFLLGKESNDPLAMYMADYFTLANNLVGLPALSLPCGFSAEGLPMGFQFIGPRLSEELMYRTAYAFEQQTGYHLQHPQGFQD